MSDSTSIDLKPRLAEEEARRKAAEDRIVAEVAAADKARKEVRGRGACGIR